MRLAFVFFMFFSSIFANNYFVAKAKFQTFPTEVAFVLIGYKTNKKTNYNAYATFYETDIKVILKEYNPLSLKEAIDIFPEYNLNRSNYGF